MIDIHSHILPELDDGSKSLGESVEMVRMAGAAGTTDIVASPHANNEFTFVPEVVEAKIAELQAAAGEAVHIHYGCDFHLTMDNIDDALANPGKYSIDHRGYLLVEFSDLMIPKLTAEIFGRMISSGLRPIITHPERNRLLQRRLPDLMAWVNMGCLLQVTACSFTERFGRSAKAFSEELLRRGLIHVLASDAHDTSDRPPVLDEIYSLIARDYGEESANAMMVENPRAILAGVPLPTGPARFVVKKKKKWYRF